MKSTVEQIRERFDKDVERFSNLETGQVATIDSPLCMDLVTQAAAITTPEATAFLDIGCGAGNYSIKLLQRFAAERDQQRPAVDVTLMDLSKPMLDRAVERVTPFTTGKVSTLQGDMRELPLGNETFDIVITAAALHHLRTPVEWQDVFSAVFDALRPGGSFWIFDMIEHSTRGIQKAMRNRYGDYLSSVKGGGVEGEKYRDSVFAYIAQEDTPAPLMFQVQLMMSVGFEDVDILHKNSLFAAFGAKKPNR